MTVVDMLAKGNLIVPFDRSVAAVHSFYIVCRNEVRSTPIVKVFIDWIYAALAEHDARAEPQVSGPLQPAPPRRKERRPGRAQITARIGRANDRAAQRAVDGAAAARRCEETQACPIEAEPMTLLFNPAVRHLAAPPIPEVQRWARAYDGRHGPLLDFSQAVPGYPPHADLLAWLGEASASPAYTGYGDIEGEPVLRQAYAAHVSSLYGSTVAASEIQITSGCNQAFFATMLALAAPGDDVILVRPFYFNHEMTLDMLGIAVNARRCEGGRRFRAVAGCGRRRDRPAHARRRAGVAQQPDRRRLSAAVLQAVFEVCRERGIWLIVG